MKCKHYFYFDESYGIIGDSLDKDNWELIRCQDRNSPFAIEKEIEEYEKNCRDNVEYEIVANSVVNVISLLDISRVVSLGSGKGILEWFIKQMVPDVWIECTDYTVNAMERLKLVFTNLDDAYAFDMLTDDYSKLVGENTIILIFRLSTEFSEEQWVDILKKMRLAGIQYIIYIPTGLDSIKTMFAEMSSHLSHCLRGIKDTFCGWLFSKKHFLKMFKKGGYIQAYSERCGNSMLFVLKAK